MMNIDGVNLRSHQISWMIHKGKIPEGLWVLHNCRPNPDNRRCVNPDHLWLGTQQENLRDANDKGMTPTGDAHWNTKISDADVPKIFGLIKIGTPQKEIARSFGVGPDQISRIVNGKRRHALVASLHP